MNDQNAVELFMNDEKMRDSKRNTKIKEDENKYQKRKHNRRQREREAVAFPQDMSKEGFCWERIFNAT